MRPDAGPDDASLVRASLQGDPEAFAVLISRHAPSVLSEIPLEAQIMNEEPFGPVALINPYKGEAEMIAEANRLPYGLAAEIESGMVGINSHMIGGADAPFGGVKWSGHGSEDAPEGVLACMVLKAVHEG